MIHIMSKDIASLCHLMVDVGYVSQYEESRFSLNKNDSKR